MRISISTATHLSTRGKPISPGRFYTTGWSAHQARAAFFDYFSAKGHTFVPSSSTVPPNDPTLMFTNAGMNQFKPILLGIADPSTALGRLKRAYNVQKCVRAGGKHNDLEEVGKDVYHHTFFEMLGSWSFGDYFKKEALAMGWELLTAVYKLPADRLYVTYYGGDAASGLEADLETRDLWRQLGVHESRILPFGSRENFWEMGDQGPCGPSSEIHFDRVGNRDASQLVNRGDPDVLELWNLVFVQFNREPDGSLRRLPTKHVDTGMGLERILSVLQGKRSNYDTDLFTPIFAQIQKLTGARPYRGRVGAMDADGVDMGYRLVADHARLLLVAISDGGVPSNVGRGYVLRRILRRGCRFARVKLGTTLGGFFPSLMEAVAETLREAYPEVAARAARVEAILEEEELSFARTLDRGERLFKGLLAAAETAGLIAGADAWKLYDTFGFPLDLTRLMAKEKGLDVNLSEFEAEAAKARGLSRSPCGGSPNLSSNVVLDVHDVATLEEGGIPKPMTVKSTSRGLQALEPRCGGFSSDMRFTRARMSWGCRGTNFYAESGGQGSDRGSLVTPGGSTFLVEGAHHYGGYVLHSGVLRNGTIALGQEVTAVYDGDRRASLACNHTATHLLNLALRKVLGSEGVDQKGSLKALATEQLQQVEALCNHMIDQDLKVYTREIPLETATTLLGLRTLPGNAYPDPVRIVAVGPSFERVLADPQNEAWREYSMELCGGTHVSSTKALGGFVLLEETSLAKGVRRMVALTGSQAASARRAAATLEKAVASACQLGGGEWEVALKKLTKDLCEAKISCVCRAQLQNQLATAKKTFKKGLKASKEREAAEAVAVIAERIAAAPEGGCIVEVFRMSPNAKAFNDMVSIAGTSYALHVFFVAEGSAQVFHQCFVPPPLVERGLKASEWAGLATTLLGGKSGGRGGQAQGWGVKVEALDETLAAVRAFALKILGQAAR
ncbi:Alanine--tRNA ligase [Massospora cicadina]|nr:Alanine--tRNA ligase [Massospora cicadina]